MTVSVRDARAMRSDRDWLERVYRDYLDDLSPLDTGLFPALTEVGHREHDQIARWFADPNALPLIIVKQSERVGFALVQCTPSAAASRPSRYRMAEFFVVRERRGLGIGRVAARLIFDRFAGRWEIIEYARNPHAVRFWRRVLAVYARGSVEERTTNGEVRQTFDSRGAARGRGRPQTLPS